MRLCYNEHANKNGAALRLPNKRAAPNHVGMVVLYHTSKHYAKEVFFVGL